MKKQLLIVDDDRSVCQALRKLLEVEGYKVFTAYDAAEAIEQFRHQAIDLVVLDVNLGDDDGWAVFQTMVGIKPFVPTVVVTAEFGQRERAIAAGVEALIEKPIDVPSFLQLIDILLTETSEHSLNRICDEESYCHYVAKDYSTFLRLLHERGSAPIELSPEIKAALPRRAAGSRKAPAFNHPTVVGDPTLSIPGGRHK